MACRVISVFAVAWYSRFSRPCFAPCALARGPSMLRERSRKGAKKQVWLAAASRYSQWPGIADVWVLALRLALARGPLMLRESSRKGAKAKKQVVACRAIPVFAVAWYSRCSGPCFAPLRFARGPSMLRERSRKGAKAKKQVVACRAIPGFAVAWYSRFQVLALRLAPCARSFDAAGKLTQRRKGARSR